MNRLEMQQRLAAIQEEAEIIKQALNNCFPTLEESVPGNKLEDGWVVVEKYKDAALLAAPQDTERFLSWNDLNGDCFIPTVEQLQLAYKNARQHFKSTYYWSSAEDSATSACYVNFNNGKQYTDSKTATSCVRAFRFVVF